MVHYYNVLFYEIRVVEYRQQIKLNPLRLLNFQNSYSWQYKICKVKHEINLMCIYHIYIIKHNLYVLNFVRGQPEITIYICAQYLQIMCYSYCLGAQWSSWHVTAGSLASSVTYPANLSRRYCRDRISAWNRWWKKRRHNYLGQVNANKRQA